MPSWHQVSSFMFLSLVQACVYQSIRKSDYCWLSQVRESAVKMTRCPNHEINIRISPLKISPILLLWRHILTMIPLGALYITVLWFAARKCSIHQLYLLYLMSFLSSWLLHKETQPYFKKSKNFLSHQLSDTGKTKARIAKWIVLMPSWRSQAQEMDASQTDRPRWQLLHGRDWGCVGDCQFG